MKYSLIDGSLNLQSMLSLSFSNRCSEEEFSIYSHLQKTKKQKHQRLVKNVI